MLTVYYDGKCGLCRREIEYYKRVAPADRFVWFDIATDPGSLADLNISQADALRRLHACGRVYRYLASFGLLALSGNDHQPTAFATSGSFCL